MSQQSLFFAGIDSGADISPCGIYRYSLWRGACHASGMVNWLMLNPSVADAIKNDPTAHRCIAYTKDWGYGDLVVTNLFALRSTDPDALRNHPDPIGPDNDRYILEYAKKASVVICAWGAHGSLGGRSSAVRRMLADAGITPMCLAMTKGGEPGHPLYLKGNLVPVPMGAPSP
jgi:hypothetical protein